MPYHEQRHILIQIQV